MARTSVQRLRQRKDKEGNPIVKKCDVCGEPLVVGEQYRTVWNFYNSWDMHLSCYAKCPRSKWESSEYLGAIYDIQDNFDADDIDSTLSSLEDLKSELEDKLDNIPEQLRDASAGSLLQERIDAIDEAISDIEGYKYEYEEIQNKEWEDYKDDFDSEEDFESDKESELDDKASDIGDALSNLEI